MKVLLAHPGKQHSFETATALKKSGLLYKYVTSIYDKEESITSKAKSLLPSKMKKKAMGRHCIALDNNDVVRHPLVQRIVKAYEDYERRAAKRDEKREEKK